MKKLFSLTRTNFGVTIGAILLVFIFPFVASFAASPDSLLKVLDTAKGKERIEVILQLLKARNKMSTEQELQLAEEVIALSETQKDKDLTLRTLTEVGVFHRNRGRTGTALGLFLEALQQAEKAGNLARQGDLLHKIGVTYLLVRDYTQALHYAKKEQPIWFSLKNTKDLGSSYNLEGISLIYLKRPQEAFEPLQKALDIANQNDDLDLRYKSYTNIGDAFLKLNQLDTALALIRKSYEIGEKLNDMYAINTNLLKIGEVYAARGNLNEAIGTLKQGISLAEALRSPALMRNGYEALTGAYAARQDWENAYKFQALAKIMNDSLSNMTKAQEIANLHHFYDRKRQQQELSLIQEQIKNDKLYNYFLSAIIFFLVILSAFFWYSFKNNQKANISLKKQNEEIKLIYQQMSAQAGIIEETNTKITESINYAKRIQDAIQINTTDILEKFPQHFILNKPRDIVSGDCYWFGQHQQTYYVAVVDCTGHGIAGAFMTILCISLLNDLFNQFKNKKEAFTPADLLSELHLRLIEQLHQKQTNIADGMDMALCAINTQNQNFTYAGEKMPLLYIESQQAKWKYIKADVFPIGGIHKNDRREYQNHSFGYAKGDKFYLASDGYQDQFGGKNDRKFMKKRFHELLYEIHPLPFEKQLDKLEETHLKWKGKNAQTDDIIVLGMQI
jgi:serine phosphatase RsbU (regulator of sigma subunit)